MREEVQSGTAKIPARALRGFRPWLFWGAVGMAWLVATGCSTTPKKPDAEPAVSSPQDSGSKPAASEAAAAETNGGAGTPETPAKSDAATTKPAEGPAEKPAANTTEASAAAPSSTVTPATPAGATGETTSPASGDSSGGGLSQALANFQAALSGDPNNVEALFNKGIVCSKKGDLKEAEASFKRVTELRPKFNGGWANLVDVYRIQKDYTRAMETVEEGLKQLPGDALLLNSRALIMRLQGKVPESIEEVRKILKVNAIDVNAFNNMGRTYLELKDYDMAQVIFLKALQSAPGAEKDPWIHNNLGLTYMGLKDPRAAGEFDRALELNPDLLEALVCRSYLHLELQEYEKAAELLRRALAFAPNSIVIRLDLGVALRGLNKLPEAEMQYQEALRLEPKNTAVLLNYGILLGDYRKDYSRALEVYTLLRDASAAGPELERAEKLVKDTAKQKEREEKRKRDAAAKAAKPEPTPAPTPTPAPEGTGGAPTESGGSSTNPSAPASGGKTPP